MRMCLISAILIAGGIWVVAASNIAAQEGASPSSQAQKAWNATVMELKTFNDKLYRTLALPGLEQEKEQTLERLKEWQVKLAAQSTGEELLLPAAYRADRCGWQAFLSIMHARILKQAYLENSSHANPDPKGKRRELATQALAFLDQGFKLKTEAEKPEAPQAFVTWMERSEVRLGAYLHLLKATAHAILLDAGGPETNREMAKNEWEAAVNGYEGTMSVPPSLELKAIVDPSNPEPQKVTIIMTAVSWVGLGVMCISIIGYVALARTGQVPVVVQHMMLGFFRIQIYGVKCWRCLCRRGDFVETKACAAGGS